MTPSPDEPPNGSTRGPSEQPERADVPESADRANRAESAAPRGAAVERALAEEVRRRIAGGEGTRTEFKRSFSTAEKLARTCAAFANAAGGLLLIGVEDDGSVCGVGAAAAHGQNDIADDVGRAAREESHPPVRTHAFSVELDGRRVVAVFVPRSDAAPHLAPAHDGTHKPMLRRAASTRETDEVELRRRLAEREELDADEASVLAALVAATRAGAFERTTLDAVAYATGLGRSRVRRALHKLDRGGWCLALGGAAPSRLHLAW